MKEQIQQVQAYFITKILNGEITVTEASEHIIIFLVDDEFQFIFWMSNGADSCQQWISSQTNFIHLPEPNEEEKESYFKSLQPHYATHMKDVTIKAKQEELAKLSEEINNINKLSDYAEKGNAIEKDAINSINNL